MTKTFCKILLEFRHCRKLYPFGKNTGFLTFFTMIVFNQNPGLLQFSSISWSSNTIAEWSVVICQISWRLNSLWIFSIELIRCWRGIKMPPFIKQTRWRIIFQWFQKAIILFSCPLMGQTCGYFYLRWHCCAYSAI